MESLPRESLGTISPLPRLGLVYSEFSKELIEDDGLWEIAKDLPIDPDNPIDGMNKMLKEATSNEERLELIRKDLNRKPYS